MAISTATATFRVRLAAAGATSMGTPDLTLAISDLAGVPILSGPSVDVLAATTVSHPFRVECIVDTPLFLSSGRLTELGRLIDVQRADDGGAYATLATGRVSHVSEIERGKVVIEVSDERWVERKTEIFRTTTSVQLHPPGLASAWLTKPAAGTRTYTVAEVSGDAVRIKPNNETEFDAVLHIPMALRQALVSDLAPLSAQAASASHSAGNFNELRFRYDSADRTVIAFKQGFNFSLGTDQPVGPLGNLSPAASGLLIDAWVYIAGHSLIATDQITGRFYWPGGVEIGEHVPVHIGGSAGIHPFELLEDILGGDYGGQAVRFDATSMQALQDAPYKPVWARKAEPEDRAKWLGRSIYAPYGVLPLVGTDLNLRPTSLRLPLDINPSTYTVLDASNASIPTWEHTSRDLVTVLEFIARYPRPLSVSGVRPDDWPVDDYETKPLRLPKFEHDNTATLGEVDRVVDTDLILSTSSLWSGIPNDVANELAVELFDVFGDGAQLGEVTVPQDLGLEVGEFVVLDHDTLKGFNPGTGARTGERVVLLLSWRDWGPAEITFGYLDMGPNSSPLAAPTVSIAQDGTNPDLVNVTISALPAGASATVECTAAASPPTTFDQIKAGVGNETVSFLLGAASGTAYCRAYSTAPNRIRSAYATDSVVLSTRARIVTADVVMTAGEATVTWTVAAGTAGMRTRYDIHARGEDPTFANQTDYDATDGGFTINGLGPRQVVSVELTPYTGWTGSAVSGTAGAVLVDQAISPRVTGGIATLPPVRIVDPRTDWTPAGALRVRVNTEGAQYVRVVVSTSAFPSEATVDAATAQAVDANGFVEISDAGPFGLGEEAFIGVKAYEFSSGDTDASPLVTIQATRPATTAPRIATAVAQSGSTGSLDLTIQDPTLSVTLIQFAEKTDAGAYGSLATTWDRSTGTIGSSAVLTRGEDITLASKHSVSVRWVVTYDDEQGTSRTIEGSHSFDSDLIAEVTNIGIGFDENGECVVSVAGDEDTSALYVTVDVDTDPSDPTVGTNDGNIVGREGVIATGVKIPTGSVAHVRVGAVDINDVFGPIVNARQERRIGPFAKDVSNPSVTGTTSETVIKTITVPAGTLGQDGMLTLRAFFITSGAGNKTIRFYWGGTAEWVLVVPSTGVGVHVEIVLFNTASDSAQGWIGTAHREADDVTFSAGPATIDTSVDQDIEFTVELVDTGHSVALPFVFAKYEGTD